MQFAEMLIPMVASFALTIIVLPLFIGICASKKRRADDSRGRAQVA